jgi:hypothetical protein
MLIFKNKKYYIYIHIPKNGGKYIRHKLTSNKHNELIHAYWCTKDKLDLAHIPYMKRNEYIDPKIEYHYFTYSRNPYHRLISAYFYLCNMNNHPFLSGKDNIQDFRSFIKMILKKYNFSLEFKSDMIHFYPQYLFICDEHFQIPKTIKIMKLEDYENPPIYNLNEYYDHETLQCVNQIYKKDFELLDYPMINQVKLNLMFSHSQMM